jgi:membrane protease YdiL (CAAX protease family)
VIFVLAMLPGVFVVPFLYQRNETSGPEQVSTSVQGVQPRLAIFTNGLFFAAMHSAVWPSPIPLFLLGMALAWLTYRTSSLVGAVTLHALVNATAVLSLSFQSVWA